MSTLADNTVTAEQREAGGDKKTQIPLSVLLIIYGDASFALHYRNNVFVGDY